MTIPSQPPASRRMRNHAALRIASIYFVLAGSYILYSDWLLAKLFDDATIQRLSEFQTIKGMGFVLVSAILLYFMIARGMKHIRGSASQAERNRRWFEAFMHNHPGVAFLKDREGRHVFLNDRLMKMLSHLHANPLGKTNEQLWPPEIAEEFGRNDRFVMENRQILQRIEHLRDPDGQMHYWLITKFPIEDADGEIAVGGAGVEVTERVVSEQRIRALNEELQQANGLKDQFLAVMSHELRTPITAIRLWAQLLRDGDAESTREAIEMIEQSAATQAQLIEDLLDVSRILTGRLHVELRAVDPLPAIESAINAMRPSANEQGVELHATMPAPGDAPISIMANSRRIQQMAWNLLHNAIKFTPRGGRVDVIVERRDRALVLTIRDTGKGIIAEFLPHLFEHFRQSDTSTTRKHGGLGIGLSIVKHMVQLHHGTIEARSDGENKGATFVIELPLADAPPGTDAPPVHSVAEERNRLDGVRIVLAEDHADARLAMQTVLRQAGAEVAGFATAQEALDAVRRTRPHILLSDVAMPDQDGIWLIHQIRADPAGDAVRAGAISAYAQNEDRDRAIEAGYDDYLVKPIQAGELIRFVELLRNK